MYSHRAGDNHSSRGVGVLVRVVGVHLTVNKRAVRLSWLQSDTGSIRS
jgi:hypothetical protein